MGYALRHLERCEEGMLFYMRAFDGNVRMYGVDHELTRQSSEAKALDEYRAFIFLVARAETGEMRELEEDYGADHPEESSGGCAWDSKAHSSSGSTSSCNTFLGSRESYSHVHICQC